MTLPVNGHAVNKSLLHPALTARVSCTQDMARALVEMELRPGYITRWLRMRESEVRKIWHQVHHRPPSRGKMPESINFAYIQGEKCIQASLFTASWIRLRRVSDEATAFIRSWTIYQKEFGRQCIIDANRAWLLARNAQDGYIHFATCPTCAHRLIYDPFGNAWRWTCSVCKTVHEPRRLRIVSSKSL